MMSSVHSGVRLKPNDKVILGVVHFDRGTEVKFWLQIIKEMDASKEIFVLYFDIKNIVFIW